jgi:ketosteroid isomerase-like protein
MNTAIETYTSSTQASAARHILQSALTALGNGRISEIMDVFDDRFTFNDQALKLQFTDKERLSEFFHKGRELFPDTALELISTFECGNHIVAEWKITAREIMPLGSMQLRLPISFQGVSIVRIENGKITSWSDYYDQNTSRRFRLGAFFEEWIEY